MKAEPRCRVDGRVAVGPEGGTSEDGASDGGASDSTYGESARHHK